MEAAQLEKYRKQLVVLRARLTGDVERIAEAVAEDVNARGDISHIPTHMADRDSEGIDKEIALEKNETELLRNVRAALDRIAHGTYGKCAHCGQPIGKPRLNAIPYTPYCIECERQKEQGAEWALEE